MSFADYQPPVSQLLTYGDARRFDKWPNYVRKFKLEPQHIPELIQLATDEELSDADPDRPEVWSPLHAWRALGQLQAISALEPLLDLLNEQDDDWLSEDFPELCTLIGLETIPVLERFLADSSRNPYAKIDVAGSLAILGEKYPEARASAIAAIVKELEKFKDNEPEINGLLVAFLLDLEAVESAATIERAFKSRRVSTAVTGDWEEVQVELGLKTWDDFPARGESMKQFSKLFSSAGASIPKGQGFGTTSPDPKKSKSRQSSSKKKKR